MLSRNNHEQPRSEQQAFRIVGGKAVAKILGDYPRIKELIRRAYILHMAKC